MAEPPSAPEPHPSSRRRSWLQWYNYPQKNSANDITASLQDAGLSKHQPERRYTHSFYDTGSSTSRAEPGSRVSSRPSTPRSISTASVSHLFSFQSTPHSPSCTQVDQPSTVSNDHSSQTIPPPPPPPTSTSGPKADLSSRTTGSFGKLSINSMLGGFSLSRGSTGDDRDKESRGRSSSKRKTRSSSFVLPHKDASVPSKESTRARSQSPFSLRRWRSRDRESSPTPLPLEESDCESVTTGRSPAVRPRTAFTDDPDSGSEYAGEETEDEEDDSSDGATGIYDIVTERNTERNAFISNVAADGSLACEIDADVDGDAAFDPDPLGEGVNVVVPHEPYFPSTLNRSSFSSSRSKRGPKRKKSRPYEVLPLSTSRPVFERDRCTITIVQGNPTASERRKKTYIVASDLSEESRYAVEWGIGTVLRDGDEMLIVTVVENDSKVDPLVPNTDRATKLRSQQEGLAYILVRQATSLLQRTRLNVTVSCQAWHAKNARHMLLDIVDYNEPTMLIVGSRGLGQLRGILLGSTSHYLIQRCSVPVMVTRRRLKRPPKRSAHLTQHRARVSLVEAAQIDRVAAKVDQDVAVMRDEMQRENDRMGDGSSIPEGGEADEVADGEGDGAEGEGYLGVKVRG
ncbi:hypothetical protein ID866_3127 [Astraeus odoratus]|nr:hypothetical protein ID866_3127 [Astraeus odoratus]